MKTKSLFLSLFIIAFAISSFAQKADFSGSWKLNEGKSNLGNSQFRMGATKITAKQDAKMLNLEQVSRGRNDEERTTTVKYALDGSESENAVFQNFVRKSKASWSADGKILTINSSMTFERDGEKTEFKSTETWKLGDDGKSLTIETSSTTPNGEMKQTRVYDKV